MNQFHKIILTVILLFAFLSRIVLIQSSPPALYIDEIDVGYQAYSILKTGKDYFGNNLPIAIHSFADYRAPLLIYLDIPFVAILGLNSLAVRLPSMIFGTLSIFAFYLLFHGRCALERLACNARGLGQHVRLLLCAGILFRFLGHRATFQGAQMSMEYRSAVSLERE